MELPVSFGLIGIGIWKKYPLLLEITKCLSGLLRSRCLISLTMLISTEYPHWPNCDCKFSLIWPLVRGYYYWIYVDCLRSDNNICSRSMDRRTSPEFITRVGCAIRATYIIREIPQLYFPY